MKLLVQSSKRFHSGRDLNRLETSFVKTSIRDLSFISFFFTRSLQHLGVVIHPSWLPYSTDSYFPDFWICICQLCFMTNINFTNMKNTAGKSATFTSASNYLGSTLFNNMEWFAMKGLQFMGWQAGLILNAIGAPS